MDPRGRGRRYEEAIILSPDIYNPDIHPYIQVFYNRDDTRFPFMRNMMTINLPTLGLQVTQINSPACTGGGLNHQRQEVQGGFAQELRRFLTLHHYDNLQMVVMGALNKHERWAC